MRMENIKQYKAGVRAGGACVERARATCVLGG